MQLLCSPSLFSPLHSTPLMGSLSSWPLRIMNSCRQCSSDTCSDSQNEFQKHLPRQALATLSLCDSPWLHQLCLSLTANVFVRPLGVRVAVVRFCMVPARIMRLAGDSCSGLRLGINPTDGAGLGSKLCIWWPGGRLANGAHTRTQPCPMHTCMAKLDTQDLNTFYHKTASANFIWLALSDVDRTLLEGVHVFVWVVCASQTLKVRGQVVRVICHMLCHLLLIPYPLPHGTAQTDRQTPATLHSPLF